MLFSPAEWYNIIKVKLGSIWQLMISFYKEVLWNVFWVTILHLQLLPYCYEPKTGNMGEMKSANKITGFLELSSSVFDILVRNAKLT